jgi:nucleotide-binding universal stress UspA family protein
MTAPADRTRPKTIVVGVERRVVQEAPAAALVAASRDADLLVVGSRGRGGIAGLLLGSARAHQSPCPLVVVRHWGNGSAPRRTTA